MKLYSASTGGFYHPSIHGPRKLAIIDPEDENSTIEIDNPDCKIPADAVEITEERHAELMAAQDAGAQIKPDAAGNPVAVFRAPETRQELLSRAQIDIRKQRAPIMSTLDGIAGRASRAGDMATAQAADAAIVALLDITKLPTLLQAETYDDMKAAVLDQYHQIATAAPAVVQLAFLEAIAP